MRRLSSFSKSADKNFAKRRRKKVIRSPRVILWRQNIAVCPWCDDCFHFVRDSTTRLSKHKLGFFCSTLSVVLRIKRRIHALSITQFQRSLFASFLNDNQWCWLCSETICEVTQASWTFGPLKDAIDDLSTMNRMICRLIDFNNVQPHPWSLSPRHSLLSLFPNNLQAWKS